jgi:hypothetical protein
VAKSGVRDRGLTRGAHIVRTDGMESLFCSTLLFTAFDVYGEQNVSASDLALVVFGRVLRNPEADERSSDTAHGSAYGDATQGTQERTRCEKRPNAWNGERADACEHAERPANHAAARSAYGCSFGGLRIFLHQDIAPHGRLVGEQRRHVARTEAGTFQRLHGSIRALSRVNHTDYGVLFRQGPVHGITSN